MNVYNKFRTETQVEKKLKSKMERRNYETRSEKKQSEELKKLIIH